MIKTVVGAVVAAVLSGIVLQSMGADQSTTKVAGTQPEPIRILGDEQKKIVANLPDGGLPPAVGVQNFQVFRASRDAADITDGKGWTYNHHVDIAAWRGRLYVAWTNGEKDEDIWPAREVYSTSEDGVNWSRPGELFPMGVSTSLRAYFFRAPDGRMLTFAGLRVSQDKLDEAKKDGAVVREIRADHSLGDVFTLIASPEAKSSPQFYKTSGDPKFVEACGQLLADRPVLEQQDYGVLLGDRRMKWHDVAAGNRRMKSFGKAFSFFHRKDGDLVGIAKSGWTTLSSDEGETWSEPVHPKTLITNLAKVAAAHTADDRYALVYNPKEKDRFPLVIVTGDDGETFGDMRVVHGEVPRERYQGESKNIGAQYVRAIADWASDGSWKDKAMWVAYSSNKEDVWVSRIPLPVKGAEENRVADRFDDLAAGGIVPGWNTYSPKWAKVGLVDLPNALGKALQLEDADPYDYARAERVFPASQKVSVQFDVQVEKGGHGQLEVELCSAFGGARPVRILLADEIESKNQTTNGEAAIPRIVLADGWTTIRIDADAKAGKFSWAIGNAPALKEAACFEPANDLARISFRTGEYRGVGMLDPVAAGTDKPVESVRFLIRRVSIQ
jgi:hypothetical protein